jgi:hypothetical protein
VGDSSPNQCFPPPLDMLPYPLWDIGNLAPFFRRTVHSLFPGFIFGTSANRFVFSLSPHGGTSTFARSTRITLQIALTLRA